MEAGQLKDKSIDELWSLHVQIAELLSSKIKEEKARLEKRLRQLHTQTVGRSDGKRPYPPVLPKYRNPAEPSETWAGRGKKPRWVVAALKKGKRLEDFRIVA